RGDGGHPGGKSESPLSVFQIGNQLLQGGPGGIAGAGILISPVPADSLLLVGGNLVNGNADGSVVRIAEQAPVDAFGVPWQRFTRPLCKFACSDIARCRRER